MSVVISRRDLLLRTLPGVGLEAAVVAQAKQSGSTQSKRSKLPPRVGEFVRVIDPVTENTIVRLTALASTNILPLARNRFISTRERTLLFSSDRSGHFAPYQVDLRTGAIKQIAEPAQLDPRSLCFDRQEKLVRYLDGNSLFEVSVNRGTPKLLGEGYSAFNGASSDGSLYVISDGALTRKDGSNTGPIANNVTDAWPQPNGSGCVFSRKSGEGEYELHYVALNLPNQSEPLTSGHVRQPFWDSDGQSVLFLREIESSSGVMISEIHGKSIQGGKEYLVAPTSQFGCFAPNSDSTVFVGASRSKAQPTVVLLLRSPHRELTLCEHHSSNPGSVSPVFSPDNRRIYFESDREGKMAIYSVNVESLVEPPITA